MAGFDSADANVSLDGDITSSWIACFTSSGVSQASKKTSSHSLSSASNITFMTLRDLLYGFEDNIDAAMHWW